MTIPFSVLVLLMVRGLVSELLVDPIYHECRRSLRITRYLQAWSTKQKHKYHTEIIWESKVCLLRSTQWDPMIEEKKVQDYFFRWEKIRLKLSINSQLLSRYREEQEILYDKGRLTVEFQSKDLDQVNLEYLDKHEIMDPVPIVWWDSPMLYLYIMLIHTKTNMHAALEPTVKDKHKMMRVPRGLRRLVRKVRSDCISCRILSMKTVELKIANHPEARTKLAQCFYACMMDICYGFKGQPYKRARSVFKVYGLVWYV